MEELTKIVHKIANYVPWQSEGLTEDEFRVLDQASGYDLAEIAYKSRINFNRFLKNADEMINIHNEQIIWSQLKEVRSLKRSLQNPVPFNRPKQKDNVTRVSKKVPETRQQAAVDNRANNVENIQPEVINLVEEPEELIVDQPQIIENEPVQTAAKEVTHNRSFVSSLLGQTDPWSKSIPMHRNVMRATDNITLNQNIDRIESHVPGEIDDLPVLNEADIAKLGFFDGDQGRKISKIIHQRDQSVPLPDNNPPAHLLSLEEDIQPLPLIEQLESMQLEERNKTYDQINQQLEALHAEEPIQLLEAPENIQLPENIQQSLNIQQPDNVLDINEQSLQQPQIIENVQQPVQNEQLLQRSDSSASVRDSMAERYESFRNAVDAADALLGKAKRRVRRPQRPQRPERQQTSSDNEFSLLKMRKEIPCKAKKKQRARPVKHPKRSNIGSNLFEDIEIYLSHDLPFEDYEEQEMTPVIEVPPVAQNRQSDFALEFDPVTSHHRVLTSTPMTSQNKKRSVVSPEAQQTSKRVRRMESIDEIRDANIQAENILVPENPQETTEPGFSIPNLPASIQESNYLAPIMEIPEPAPHVSLPPLVDIPVIDPQPMYNLPEEPVPQQNTVQESQVQQESVQMEVPQIDTIETPKDQSLPQARRQSRRLALVQKLHISAEDVDYDRLRRNSKLRKAPVDSRSQILPDEIFQNACENISEREAIRIRNSQLEGSIISPQIRDENVIENAAQPEEIIKAPQKKFRNIPRVYMNDKEYLEITNINESKKNYYTEHHMCCMTLCLKIRFLMEQLKGNDPWIISIDELFQQLKDWKGTKIEIYHQILDMTQKGVFIPKFNELGDLIEIEHPLNRFEDASDKENVE